MPTIPASPARLACYTSRGRLLAQLPLALGATAVSAWCLLHDDLLAWAFGGLGVLFFGAITLMIARELVRAAGRRSPEVVFDESGIHVRRWHLGTVPWHDFDEIFVYRTRGQRFLCVTFRDRDHYLARLPRWHRWLSAANERLGAGTLWISFQTLTPGLDAALAFLDARVPASPPAQPGSSHRT